MESTFIPHTNYREKHYREWLEEFYRIVAFHMSFGTKYQKSSEKRLQLIVQNPSSSM